MAGRSRADAFTIIATFDSTITTNLDAVRIMKTIRYAIAEFEGTINDPTVVNILFQVDETDVAFTGYSRTDGVTVNYADYWEALRVHQTSLDDITAFARLTSPPGGDPYAHQSLKLRRPIARTLSLTNVVADGAIGFYASRCNIDPTYDLDGSKFSLFSTVCHEIDEVLCMVSTLDDQLIQEGPLPTAYLGPIDLFRYNQNGLRTYDTHLNTEAYFSLDGTNRLMQFNQDVSGDRQDWYSPGGQTPHVQDARGTAGAQETMGMEWRALDVIG